jgi:competence protein ComEA
MPPTLPSKPQLAIYVALAIAVLLIGARFLRHGGGGAADAGALPAFAATVPAAGAGGVAAAGGAAGADGALGAAGAAAAAGATGGAGDASGLAGDAGPRLVVDVKGAVRRPGVYRLPAGARAYDAVRRAGGLTHRADRIGVNLAARVVDGGEVVVPARGSGGAVRSAADAPAPGGAGSGGAAGGAPLSLDLNTATEQELEQLDGVGPATAAKIVAYREQHGGIGSVEELDNVSGIGPAKLAAIRAQLGR